MLARRFVGFLFGAAALFGALAVVYAGLAWLQIPTGTLVDWVVGGLSLWWLLVITTVPWDLHFEARDVLAEAAGARERGIAVEPHQLRYAERVANRALAAAINLHVGSALAL